MESAAAQHAAGPGTQTSCFLGPSQRLTDRRLEGHRVPRQVRRLQCSLGALSKGDATVLLGVQPTSPCLLQAQPAFPPSGEGLGPRGRTFHVMLLKATPCGSPSQGFCTS